MNANEPVAWMQTFTHVKDGVELVKHAVNIEQVGINDIPLYTHPVPQPMQILEDGQIMPVFKELTDEEMKDLIQEYWGDVHIVDPDGYLHEIAFIRAILRKASEKC